MKRACSSFKPSRSWCAVILAVALLFSANAAWAGEAIKYTGSEPTKALLLWVQNRLFSGITLPVTTQGKHFYPGAAYPNGAPLGNIVSIDVTTG
ncbi:MAG: hypothetical protein LBT08_03265, partial [Synergistaceae bacterium]|nr:hypothetical protein [Synergistaceae bacterium]